jgi:phage terminase large subunit GpA-like protein
VQLNLRDELSRAREDLAVLSSERAHPNLYRLALLDIDLLRPTESISTREVAEKFRLLPSYGGGQVRYQPAKTPYLEEIDDAMDDVTKRMVLVQGPARAGKTTTPENYLLKVAKFGPSRGVLWYMHSEPDLRRYVDERVEFFFREHEGLSEKIGGRGGRGKWNLKIVDGQVWEWLPANTSTTRARSAAFIVADEIDAMRPAIGDAIVTLILNRQREYGSLAKAFIASHPDRGPTHGIAKLLEDSDRRLRYWTCPDCAHLVSPCQEAPRERRVTWNVPELMEAAEDMNRDEILDYVGANVFLICPHCKAKIDNEGRLELDQSGLWIGKGQEIDANENVVGTIAYNQIAGFIIHGFMSPFVKLGELAREWAQAVLVFKETGSDDLLRQVNVKSLGEVHVDPDDPAAKVRDWKDVKAGHLDTGYKMRSVPRGVDFLTMMVDVQGNRFEAGVWGWSRTRECWLVDRFSIKQRLALQDISPGDRLEDWDVIEMAMNFTYPLNDGSGRHLGIAKTAVDTGGVPGVTNNARIWASNLLAAGKFPSWRIMLSKGDRHLQGELYGKVNQIKVDDAGRPLPVVVMERIVNVSAVKRVMARRLEIDEPGPGFIHLPGDVEDRFIRELVSETFVNGQWIASGRNETWDTIIMCEVARMLLAPENANIDWIGNPPSFAVPFIPSPKDKVGDTKPDERNFFDRLSDLNKGKDTRR